MAEAVEALLVVVTLTRVGFCAPQGCLVRQSLAHWLLPVPQLSTQRLLTSVQMKYGIVWLYSVTFGERPFAHTHEYWRVSCLRSACCRGGAMCGLGRTESHSLDCVAASLLVWRQMSGHCDVWARHHWSAAG